MTTGFTYSPEGDTEFDRMDATGIHTGAFIRRAVVEEGLARPTYERTTRLPWWGQTESAARTERRVHAIQFITNIMHHGGFQQFAIDQPDARMIARELAPGLEDDFAPYIPE